MIETWITLGNENPWIRHAWDPPFDHKAFYACADLDELYGKFQHGNWSLGTAFTLGELCFINQVNGGDEWLVIRRDVPFESLLASRLSREGLEAWITRVSEATDEQLRSLTY